ncbi:hypothetical protein RMATCC62417_16880 [Rhizopus microsporus]|nr:hypothetical protein RMATCC62417_16880 [Rhizopus microsporus]
MQIKLVILTICASLAAIGFAAPSPQSDPNANGLDLAIPSDGQTSPGVDDRLPGGPDESTEIPALSNSDNESMAILVRRKGGRGFRGFRGGRGGRGGRRPRGKNMIKKGPLQVPKPF